MSRPAFLLFFALGPVLTAAGPGVVPGLNRFSSSIYGKLAHPAGKNLVISPYSISTALSMALAGARGETALEIAKLLGQPVDSTTYHADLAALVDRIGAAANSGENVFLPANRVWVQRNFTLLPEFAKTLEQTYRAPAAPADFVKNPEAARREINTWTERQTRGRIKDLFAPGALDSDTRLVLTSAVYFYGKWERPFNPRQTQPAPFTPTSGAPVQTDFMNQTARYRYAEAAEGQFLEMQYAATGLAFDILLPKPGASAEMPAPDRLTAWIGALQERNVRVAIPKFRIESEFSLGATLSALGMRSAFGSDADFSGIDGRRDLNLAQAIHKAFIEVNEAGTEAAAATGLGVSLVSMPINPDPVFRADRPFLYWVRDTRSGLILFTGRLANPKM